MTLLKMQLAPESVATTPCALARTASITAAAGLFCLHAAFAFQAKPLPQPIVIGVVVLSELPAGQETSGSAVTDPAKYQEIPGLTVVTATLANLPVAAQPALAATTSTDPAVPTSVASMNGVLEGVVVDVGNGTKQPANQPFTWVPLPGDSTATLSVFLNGNTQPLATAHVPVEKPPSAPAPGTNASTFTMPTVTAAGGVEVIHGDSSGNSKEMQVAVDGTPAMIVAAKPGTVFWSVPDTLVPGAHRVVFTPGVGKPPVLLMLYVLALQMSVDQTHLLKNQSTKMSVVILGLDNLPASVWQHADTPPSDLEDMAKLQKQVPAAQLPKAADPGTVIVIISNQTPQTVRMGKKGSQIVLTLHQQDFAKGPYSYQDTLQSIQDGGFDISGTVTAFLVQATSQPAGPATSN